MYAILAPGRYILVRSPLLQLDKMKLSQVSKMDSKMLNYKF